MTFPIFLCFLQDLATGHVAALEKLNNMENTIKFYNLGTGKGVSVMQLVKTFERINNVKVPFRIEARRVGDISVMFADPTLAKNELGWEAQYTIDEMCRDFWRWQTMNPEGYRSEIINGHH